jgi:hypothetical protein
MDTTKVTPAAPSLGPYEALVQYGVLGLVVIALGFVAWKMWTKNLEEKDRLQKRVEELEKMLLEQSAKK